MAESYGDQDLRAEALKRLERKREFNTHLLIYILVNAFLVVIWSMGDSGFFWPIFVIGGWGIGIVAHAWDTFGRGPSEDRIRQEMERLRRRDA